MYYAFQQQNEDSGVIFSERCETEEELAEAITTAPYPVLFTYNDATEAITIIRPYYTLDQCHLIINNHLQ